MPNPLNQGDEQRYALIGLSRLKSIADIREYSQATAEIRKRYGGGFIWQRDVTSHYPDEGLRLPFHKYLDRPEILEQITLHPENPRLFKYATREVSDDEALSLVERFLEIARNLQDLKDDTERWPERVRWLQKLVGELWTSRGLYPGMPSILNALQLEPLIEPWKESCLEAREKDAIAEVFAFLEGRRKSIDGLALPQAEVQKLQRKWKLRSKEEQSLLRDVLPKFELDPDQVSRILSDKRGDYSVNASLANIIDNPYVLAEQYVGNNEDDLITFSTIDHGMLPSPDLGGEPALDRDDWRRLRSLLVERLRAEKQSTFSSAEVQLHKVNSRLQVLPEWKRHEYSTRYLEVDEEQLSEAIEFRKDGEATYLYWRPVYEEEREIETVVRSFAKRSDIGLKRPFTDRDWQNALFVSDSPLARKDKKAYEEAIAQQADVCQKIFVRPLSVLCGAAGTGKTTVVRSIIQAIERVHGQGTAVTLLAPTGKAADRLRAITNRDARTIHSYLAERGWMNENRTFKPEGGRQERATQTFIIDEASMLDLTVAAAFMRSVHWDSVQRLILVGDPNQLPPIGRGKVFAEIIAWLEANQPEGVARLQTNVRQMANRIEGRGTGILDAASLYLRTEVAPVDSEDAKAIAEDLLARIQRGGDVDKDLRVLYWSGVDDLNRQLLAAIVRDMENDSGKKADSERPWELWAAACELREPGEKYPRKDPEYSQVLTPYRSEVFGTEALNRMLQRHVHHVADGNKDAFRSSLEGVMLNDKVIQIKNRTKSDPLFAYDAATRQALAVEVFNGELGFVRKHAFDKGAAGRLTRFQVVFARKESQWVGYGAMLGKKPDGRGWIKTQKIEDNLELAYAISVHKAQGSEFRRVYLVVPKHKRTLLSPELFYTGLTRAKQHCTLLVEEDVSPLLEMRRREASHLLRINSSLFDFNPLPPEIVGKTDWYKEGRIYSTLVDVLVRSKSEVIIANLLASAGVSFKYEEALFGPDGTFYLPDFTLTWRGETFYWEHWGLRTKRYESHKAEKKKWYTKFFDGRLFETNEGPDITEQAKRVLQQLGATVPE